MPTAKYQQLLSSSAHCRHFIALDCPSPALLITASAADLRSPASSSRFTHSLSSTASGCPPLAFQTPLTAGQRSSALHQLPPSSPTPPTPTRPLAPTTIPPVCPAKADGTYVSHSCPSRPASRKSVGPHAPKFLPSHLPTAAESYAEWVDSLSDDLAGCLTSGLLQAHPHTDLFLYQDSYDHAPPKIDRVAPLPASLNEDYSSDTCSNEQDSISSWESYSDSNWESCGDNHSDNGTTNSDSNSIGEDSVESPLLAIRSATWLPSRAMTRDSALRLFLPYPSSSLPHAISSWWQDHQFIIVDSIFFHGYKCHPLDIEHWLGLSVTSCGGTFDSTYPQLCEERVSGLCDYLFLPDFDFDDEGNEVPSRGCVYSNYLIQLLNALVCHLLHIHKLRLTCWPSPHDFTSDDDSHSSPYCLSFSTPHTLPATYTTMYDHCKEYNSEWYRTHYGEDWYDTSTLHSIISSPATSSLIASQIQLFVSEYGPPPSDGSFLPSPSAHGTCSNLPTSTSDNSLSISSPPFSQPPLQACPSSHWDNRSTDSKSSYLSASDVPNWIPLPPEINIPWKGPTAIERLMTLAPTNQNGLDDLSVFSYTSDDWQSDGHYNTWVHGPQTLSPPSPTAPLPITPPLTTHAYTRADELLMHARMISVGTYQRRLRSIRWSHRLSSPLYLHNCAYHPILTPSSVYRGPRRYLPPTKTRVTSTPPLVLPTPPARQQSLSPYTRSTIRANAISLLTRGQAQELPRPPPPLVRFRLHLFSAGMLTSLATPT